MLLYDPVRLYFKWGMLVLYVEFEKKLGFVCVEGNTVQNVDISIVVCHLFGHKFEFVDRIVA